MALFMDQQGSLQYHFAGESSSPDRSKGHLCQPLAYWPSRDIRHMATRIYEDEMPFV